MEEEKNPMQKPDTSFNRRLSVAKNPEGTWQRPRKMLRILFYKGNMTKGEYGKGYYGIYLNMSNIWIYSTLCLCLML